jgi:hypothetical protein
MKQIDFIDIVFDGPPGHEAGRFVEIEDEEGRGIRFGEWNKRDDGYWVLRIFRLDFEKEDEGQFGVGT